MKAKLGMTIFAALTVTLFTMAAIHNNDLFWGDTGHRPFPTRQGGLETRAYGRC